jgi:hypothetical protein
VHPGGKIIEGVNLPVIQIWSKFSVLLIVK